MRFAEMTDGRPSDAETRSRLAKQMGPGQRDSAPRSRRASGRGG